MNPARVVVAEDDSAIRELVVHHLAREGFRCDEAADGPAALRQSRGGASLLVLDLGLPGIHGFDVVRILRREGHMLPILILSARSDEVDRIVGLEVGADDYVVKPFSPRELTARVKAIGRRTGARPSGARVLRFRHVEIDEPAREARVRELPVPLKPREFALLLELARNAGVVLSRASLLETVWGFDFEGDERTVDVHVRRLRLKIEERAAAGRHIQTVHGCGYKFVP